MSEELQIEAQAEEPQTEEEQIEISVEEPQTEQIKPKKREKQDWDGVGDSFFSPFKRWWYTHFKGYVVVREFSEADPEEYADLERIPFDYKMTVRLVKKEKLSPLAVHCSGENGVYSIDHVHIRYDEHDYGFKAHHAWLYMGWNGWMEALVNKWSEMKINKKVLIIGGIIVAVCVIFLIVRH